MGTSEDDFNNKTMSFELNQSQKDHINSIFEVLDEDGDGSINADDVKRVFEHVGGNPSEDKLTSMFGEYGNSITREQFISITGMRLLIATEGNLMNETCQLNGNNTEVPMTTMRQQLRDGGSDDPEQEFREIWKLFSNGNTFHLQRFLDSVSAESK